MKKEQRRLKECCFRKVGKVIKETTLEDGTSGPFSLSPTRKRVPCFSDSLYKSLDEVYLPFSFLGALLLLFACFGFEFRFVLKISPNFNYGKSPEF
mmetsp:Transcript_32474/g.36831  ORF Transcript_32474/g.36831 Transcript_32474/m.36831 type:complete len:96 (+) Transcript_32474:461-748(+)